MSAAIPLSVLDQSPIRVGGTAADALNETFALARRCEALGYRRYWVAEHHASQGLAGCAPEVLLGRLGVETKTMRIGSGGVMLPHYSPYKVAENFKLLATLYPGRIDLGIGRAPGSSQYIAAALRYASRVTPELFPQMVQDLEALLRDARPVTPGMEHAKAYPVCDTVPELWLLGSSGDSAMLAAQLGLPYSFALFINPDIRDDVFDIYRANFRPGVIPSPRSMLTVFAICADTEAEAKRLALSRDLWFHRVMQSPAGGAFPSPEEAEAWPWTEQDRMVLKARMHRSAIGAPEQVVAQLRDMAAKFGADELMIVTITYDFAARLRSYELLAETWNLEGARPGAPGRQGG
jgi:luciferase family oxidoreductase group 1